MIVTQVLARRWEPWLLPCFSASRESIIPTAALSGEPVG